MGFAGLFQQARGFRAAESSGFGCRSQRITLCFRFRIAAAQIGKARRSIFGACGPKACFIGKACAARGDGTGLSRQGALRVTLSSFCRALFCKVCARCLNRFAQLRKIGRGFARLLRATTRGLCFRQFSADAFQLRGERGEAIFHL
jgi:hypothetical protein